METKKMNLQLLYVLVCLTTCFLWLRVDAQCSDGDIRLIPFRSNRMGRIEVCQSHTWYTVCDDGFGPAEATVACIQLGLITRGSGLMGWQFDHDGFVSGSGPILLDEVNCVGTEASLTECSRAGFFIHDCVHDEDVAIACPRVCNDGDVRLANGSDRAGRVEMCQADEWRPVCDDSWDNADAEVVCYQLGYGRDGVAVLNNLYGPGVAPSLLSNVQCTGNERRVFDCAHSGVTSTGSTCNSGSAGVQCNGNCTDSDVRLANGHSQYEGRVERCVSGVWDPVCSHSWDGQDATVVCRQLGFSTSDAINSVSSAWYMGDTGSARELDYIQCSGTEAELSACPVTSVFNSCPAASVICLPSTCPSLMAPNPPFTLSYVLRSTLSGSSDYTLESTYHCADSAGIATGTPGSPLRTCSGSLAQQGDWSGVAPTACIAITCPTLSPIANGHINFFPNEDPPYLVSTVAVYICDPGYVLVGVRMRTCSNVDFTSQGQWSATTPTCSTPTPLEELEYITTHQETYSNIDDEFVGHPISIPSGLPFGNAKHYTAYVGANGVISFSEPYHFYQPVSFPSDNPKIRQSYVVAPFANDLDISTDGSVSFSVYDIYNTSTTSTEYQTLRRVSQYIQGNSLLNNPTFEGLWMMFVSWEQAKLYPYSALMGTAQYNSLPSSDQQELSKENTFQAIVITNYISSYAIFTYRCGDLNSPGTNHYSAIGLNAGSSFSINHPLSMLKNVTDVACSNPSSLWTNIAYRMHSNSSVIPNPQQIQLASCWAYHSDNLFRESLTPSRYLSEAINSLRTCPCSKEEILRDRHFYEDAEDSDCFVSRFPHILGLGKSCCYRELSSSVSVRPYVSYFRHHPRLGTDDSLFETSFRSACCNDLSLGLCDLYYSRRSLNTPLSCNYGSLNSPLIRAWSIAGHHIRTFDNVVYTFMGIGEYFIMDTSNFILQARMEQASYNDSVSLFTAFVVSFDDVIFQVEVTERGDFLVQMTADDVTTENIGYMYNQTHFEIEVEETSVLIVYTHGPSVLIELGASRNFANFEVVGLSMDFQAINGGLLGNANGHTNDEFRLMNGGFVSVDVATDSQTIHTVALTWQVLQTNSLFDYHFPNQSVDTFQDPQFVPVFFHDIQGVAMQSIQAACNFNDICVFEAATNDSVYAVSNLVAYEAFSTIGRAAQSWFLGPGRIFDILLRDDAQNCHYHFVEHLTYAELLYDAGAVGIYNVTSAIAIYGIQTIITTCFNMRNSITPEDIPPLTFLYVDSEGAEITYTPMVRVCPCGSRGYCDNDATGFNPRLNVTVLDCICDLLPGRGDVLFSYQGAIDFPVVDDIASGEILIPLGGFPFYGTRETVFSVNINGAIHFRESVYDYGPVTLPYLTHPIVSVFWHDINIVEGGNVSYGITADPQVACEANSYLDSIYDPSDPNSPGNNNFNATMVIVATWDKVEPYVENFQSREMLPQNTFQVVLVTDGNISYALFLYQDLQWGTHADVAFQSETRIVYSNEHSESRITEHLDHFSNVGRSGVFVYRVDGEEILEPVPRAEEPARAYTGHACEIDVNGCDHIDCASGGSCTDIVAPGAGVSCPACPSGTISTGHKCYDINECINGTDTCDDMDGTCTNVFGSFECGCLSGFAIGPDNSCIATTDAPLLCLAENDPVWWLPYPTTLPGVNITQECPQNGTSAITGQSTRFCNTSGQWEAVDTSKCMRVEFVEIENTADEVFTQNITDIEPEEVEAIVERLVEITATNTTEGSTNFASDLGTTNDILNSTVEYLIESINVAQVDDTLLEFNEAVIDVFDNILDETNMDGWSELQETSVGSQQLLMNAEAYGQYVATSLMSESVDIGDRTGIQLVRNNIELNAQEIDPKIIDDILFPMEVEVSDTTGSAQTLIPAALLRERGAEEGNVSAVNILFTNLEQFLPKTTELKEESTRPVTQVLSTQILGNTPITKFTTLARFKFTTPKFSDNEEAINPRCAFWKFEGDVETSSWSTEGVNTTQVIEDMIRGVFEVFCESNHFTAFAVLMDVTGVLNTTSEEEQFALTVVSYVGCSISIFFLLITIVYLVALRKELFSKVHNFIHLNLAIALFLGYIVFLAGIDTAVVNRGLCVFVAALLHYLFTAVFFWMLCEGIMLYLMLVIVFTDVAKKWWIFFIIGWILPLIPVAISVGIINDQYGTSQYCWIAVGDGNRGAIWAFVVPMLVVTLVNIFFLLAGLRSVYIQRRSKMGKNKGKKQNIALFKQLIKAVVILLPLLGLTWVFGLLSVNNSTVFFSWIFTILNSLQGVFIFYFHVLRSEQVWSAITRSCRKKDDITSSTASTSGRKISITDSVLSRNTSVKSVTNDVQGFHNPTFEATIEEEDTESPTQDEPKVDDSMLIDIDETMFEPKGSSDSEEFEPDPDSDEDRKTWNRTVTFNWMRQPSKESLIDD